MNKYYLFTTLLMLMLRSALAQVSFQPIPYEVDSLAIQLVRTGDFNGDGKEDLATRLAYQPGTIGSRVEIRQGDGRGHFGAAVRYTIPHFVRELHTGDFNGDGKSDVATINDPIDNFSIPSYSLLLSNTSDSFTLVGGTFSYTTYYAVSSTVADFNEDGLLDLAIVTTSGLSKASRVTFMISDGGGGFLPPSRPYIFIQRYFGDITALDYNGDGHLDVSVNEGGGYLPYAWQWPGRFLPL